MACLLDRLDRSKGPGWIRRSGLYATHGIRELGADHCGRWTDRDGDFDLS